jgi:pheromone a factor receptor
MHVSEYLSSGVKHSLLSNRVSCRIRAIFNLLSYTNGPSPLSKNTPPKPIALKTIGYIPKSEITDAMWKVVLLQWFTIFSCSLVFFACFATGESCYS